MSTSNHRRTNKPIRRNWVNYVAAMYSEVRRLPDGSIVSFHLGNDFTCGTHGAARNMRGGKKFLRVTERRTAKNQIAEQLGLERK